MTYELARPNDVNANPSEIAAIGFLARYSGHTRDTYSINLRKWFEWCEQHGVTPLQAGRAHIEVYARQLEEIDGKKRSTVAQKLNAISGYYKLAKLDGFIADDPSEHIRRPKVPRVTTSEALTRREFLGVLDYAEEHDAQDHALLCLLGFNGLRIGEALALDIEHIGHQRGVHTVKVQREKGNRANTIALYHRTSYAFERHIGSRRQGPVFLKRTGERMDDRAANRIVRRNVKAAGIEDKRITCHSFRHTFMTMAHNSGVPAIEIQRNLGYSDMRMLSYYDHGDENIARDPTFAIGAYVELA